MNTQKTFKTCAETMIQLISKHSAQKAIINHSWDLGYEIDR